MKTIAFFNEKGGVGKTTYTILMGSWLNKHGVKVAAADFNVRLTAYRRKELEMFMNNNPGAAIDVWPIIQADHKIVAQYERKNLPGHAKWLCDEIYGGGFRGADVLLIDLPGSFAGKEQVQIMDYKLLGLNVVPTTINFQTMVGSFNTFNAMKHRMRGRIIGFFSEVVSFNSKAKYYDAKDVYKSIGFGLLPDMISSTERMNKMATPDAICSTLRYPDWEEPCYRGSKDLGLENLFIDITRELAKTPDLPNTPKADLSFVNSLKKKDDVQSLNRQLTETMFPEYELELPEDMKRAFRKNR